MAYIVQCNKQLYGLIALTYDWGNEECTMIDTIALWFLLGSESFQTIGLNQTYGIFQAIASLQAICMLLPLLSARPLNLKIRSTVICVVLSSRWKHSSLVLFDHILDIQYVLGSGFSSTTTCTRE